jgi:hypothetical protein
MRGRGDADEMFPRRLALSLDAQLVEGILRQREATLDVDLRYLRRDPYPSRLDGVPE